MLSWFKKQGPASSIFVSIASFCDADLELTVQNVFDTCSEPENLFIVICMQDEKEVYDQFKFKSHPQVKVIFIESEKSKGCCWARAEIQKYYTQEAFYLQLDSHCRLVPDWDLVCKQWLKDTSSEKPLLTSYLIAFNNKLDSDDYLKDEKPYRLEAPLFYENDKLRLEPEVIEDYLFYNQPIHAKLFSAHFVFTYGEWVKEVPYDAALYFEGEEDTLGVRSYTSGWDMYHPPRAIGYHYYTRSGEVKHHDKVKSWVDSHENSLQRMRAILQMEENDLELGIYGLGKKRSLADYEEMSGIYFERRFIKGSVRNELARKKQWSYLNGYFKRVEKSKWHEFQEGELQNEFIEIEHLPEVVVLYDKARDFFVRIIDNKSYFKSSEDEGYSDWVHFNSGQWNGEVKAKEYIQGVEERLEKCRDVFNPNQNSAIVSLRTPNTAGWAQYAAVNQLAYAHNNSHSFYLYTDLVVVEDIPHWNKVRVLMHLLPKHDYVVWVDSDAIFTNPSKTFDSYLTSYPDKSLIICNDIGGWQLNTGVMILRNTNWMRGVLKILWEMDHIPHSKAAEQSSLIQLLALNDPQQKNWQLLDQKEFNSHPKVHDENDFILHMMGMSGEERQKTFDYWNKKTSVYETANTYNLSV